MKLLRTRDPALPLKACVVLGMPRAPVQRQALAFALAGAAEAQLCAARGLCAEAITRYKLEPGTITFAHCASILPRGAAR